MIIDKWFFFSFSSSACLDKYLNSRDEAFQKNKKWETKVDDQSIKTINYVTRIVLRKAVFEWYNWSTKNQAGFRSRDFLRIGK